MPRSTVQKAPVEPAPLQAPGVVRMSRPIPVMEPVVKPVLEAPKALVCMGRCGHCDVHPCQLHTTV